MVYSDQTLTLGGRRCWILLLIFTFYPINILNYIIEALLVKGEFPAANLGEGAVIEIRVCTAV